MPAAPTLSPCAPYVAELEQEAVATRRILDRVPADKLLWRPHPKSQTLGGLALHIASTPAIVTGMLSADVVDGDQVNFTAKQPASVAEIKKAYEDGLASARATMSNWGERELSATWRFMRGGKEKMAAPRAALLRVLVLSHLVHHRGQLTVYLRMLDVPLPAIYGPSADENPFAA